MAATPLSIDDAVDIGLTAEQIAAVRRPLEQASLLPPAAYADPAVFALERERLFGRRWLPVCHASELSEPGRYVARQLAGEPVMAVRGREGEIRVMSNVCRHRNTTLTDGCGTAKGNRLVCPYHGWTYGLDGKLLAAPFMDRTEQFERREVRLREFRSEVWHGFVFVNFDDEAAPLAPSLAGLEPEVGPYRFEDMEVYELKRRVMPWNWKISLENFSEAYHQPWVHPMTADHAFPARLAEYADVTGPYGVFAMFMQDKGVVPTFFASVPGLPDALMRRVTVFNVYPYLHVLTDPSTPLWLDFNVRSVDEHELVWKVLLPPGTLAKPTLEEEMDRFRAFIEPILAEDIGVCTGIARGMQSRHTEPGRLSYMEKTVHQFHNWWLDGMLMGVRA